MSYNKKIITLSSALLALIILYILGLSFTNSHPGRGEDHYPLVSGFSADDITGFVLAGGGREFSFTKSNEGSWFVSPRFTEEQNNPYDSGVLYPGNNGRIKAFLGIILKASRTAVVTKDREKYPIFEVNQETASILTLQHMRGKKTIYLGKSDPTGMGQYARMEGEDEVFITESMDSYLLRDLVYWSNLALLPEEVKEDDIISLSFREYVPEKDQYEEYGLLKTGEGNDSWVVRGEKDIPDPVSMERLLRNLVQAKGKDFARSSPEGPIHYEIRVATLTGNEYVLLGRQAEDVVFITLRGREQPIFIMDHEIFQRIMVSRNTLFG